MGAMTDQEKKDYYHSVHQRRALTIKCLVDRKYAREAAEFYGKKVSGPDFDYDQFMRDCGFDDESD